jgi:hypothetical protein
LDLREKGAPSRKGSRKDVAGSGQLPTVDAGRVDDGAVKDSPQAPRPRPPGEATPPTHLGVALVELALILQPGHPVFLVTTDRGVHELTKVFYANGAYNVKDGYPRLGSSLLLNAALDSEGAVLTFSCDRKVHIPRGWYQVSYLEAPSP